MQKKNNLYLALITGSILVLFVLQIFWLRSVYRDYQTNFRQEANLIFKNSVTGMLDSMMVKGLSPRFLQHDLADSALWKGKMESNNTGDTVTSFQIEIIGMDPTSAKIEGFQPDSIKQIRIFSTGNPINLDSLKETIRPLVQKIDTVNSKNSFVFRFNQETIDTESIIEKFNLELAANGYDLKAKIRKAFRMAEFDSLDTDFLTLDEIPIPPGLMIQPYFENLAGYFFKKMIPPILFAILAITFISFSLFMMYRNMLKQQQLNILKNDIISNITHELKTPIATVSVVLESLQNFGANENPATKEEYIQIARDELKRLTSMTDNILKSSVLGINQSESLISLDFSNILVENLNTLKPVLDAKGFEFSFEKKGTNFRVQGNIDQLSLVIFNLMDNAIKYSKERFNIKVTLVEDSKYLVLRIEDKGIGIPESYQKDIFDKFIRVPQQDVHDVKGYGLGLAQVAEIIRLHKGKILLESQIGKGSTFIVQLPKA